MADGGRSGLMAMLNQHVQSGQTVSKEDIDEIFSRLSVLHRAIRTTLRPVYGVN